MSTADDATRRSVGYWRRGYRAGYDDGNAGVPHEIDTAHAEIASVTELPRVDGGKHTTMPQLAPVIWLPVDTFWCSGYQQGYKDGSEGLTSALDLIDELRDARRDSTHATGVTA